MPLIVEVGDRTDIVCRSCGRPIVGKGTFDPDPAHQDPKREPSLMHFDCAIITDAGLKHALLKEQDRKLKAFPKLLAACKRVLQLKISASSDEVFAEVRAAVAAAEPVDCVPDVWRY